ncbi:uncharacterized protein LOC131152687 [Malania oleifera]|uniref:uncharacterized protein LOC131152687 n=1 Tax=Malania oleifera TaxID=397392 RepID=UPI0025AEA435|nr:uncharacterized protein LOC131152687 [Malania oleifera]
MAKSPFSLLLLRRLPQLHKPSLSLLSRSHFLSTCQPTTPPSNSPDPRSSLSARMSFVFDQIDAIEKERSQKDEALQRIRAWRDSKHKNNHPKEENVVSESGVGQFIDSNVNNSNDSEEKRRERDGLVAKEVELVHPWKEWIELMERLVQQNYFDHRRKDEDRMVQDLGFDMSEVADEAVDFTRDFKTVQTACLNFGRDRFDILRSLSRQDIQLLVGYGCPSVDKKVVFSAKLLRKHAHLDEGDVCSSCSLRSSCERAYLLTNKEDEARTIDIMRILLTFGFDPVNGSVVNKPLLKVKSVKTVVRKLLHEVVKLSAVPIDPNLPPPVIKKPPPKVKQPPPPPKKRVGRDDIEMKKGDWLCPKCDFMNFAKNTVCLQCDAKRPKRQLLPGEWECPECNFLNYRRNMVCFHCEHKRPPDEFTENRTRERQPDSKMRFEKIANRIEVSNAWNFNFDDDESDGADVAAFEYADSPRMDEELEDRTQGGNLEGPENDFSHTTSRFSTTSRERGYPNPDHNRSATGFDDFDDEDDDVDCYEIETQNGAAAQQASSNDFPEIRGYAEPLQFEGSDDELPARHRMSSFPTRPSERIRRKAAFSGSEDDFDVESDEDLPVHPNWKSSHVADSRQRSRGRGAVGSSRGMNFHGDKELGVISDGDDDLDKDGPSMRGGENRWGSRRRESRRPSSDIEDDQFNGSDFDKYDLHSPRNRPQGNRAGLHRRGKPLNGRDNFDFSRNTRFRSDRKMGNRGNSFAGDFDRSYGADRGYRGREGKPLNGRDNFDFSRNTRFRSDRKMGNRGNSFADDFDRSYGADRGYRGRETRDYGRRRFEGGMDRDSGRDRRRRPIVRRSI